MSRNATIALVQMDCVMLDKEANLQKAKTFIEQAAQQHADLICFPEMFSTGYSPALIGPKYIDVAEEDVYKRQGRNWRITTLFGRCARFPEMSSAG